MSYEHLIYDVSEGVATVTLNRPDQRNALSRQMVHELIDALTTVRDDADVRCLVLTGAGKVFCAGGDLAAFKEEKPTAQRHFENGAMAQLLGLLPRLGKPSICAANGPILAGGTGLAFSCTFVIAKEGASFGMPEMNIGGFPFMVSMLASRQAPPRKVAQMAFFGETCPPEQGVEWGLINKVVPADEFDGAVADWARRLAAKSPLMLRLGADCFYEQSLLDRERASELITHYMLLAIESEDMKEGITAFFEKREPVWKGC
jgi:enoyl-CoA hydratase/carnithine racemase